MQLLIPGRLRGRIAAILVVALAIGAVVAYAIAATGYPARHVELNDGGIWVTKDSAGLTGRLNKPIGQLDAGFYPPGGAQASFSLDVGQDGGTVLAWDRGSGKLYPMTLSTCPTAFGWL
jgi:streptogramin lyase